MKRLLFCLLLLSLHSYSQTISSSRTFNWNHSGYPGSIPSPAITVDATTAGAVGDGITDNTTIIQNLINTSTGRTVIYFPTGTFLFSAALNLTDSIILRGNSADSTHLLFNCNGAVCNGLNITGGAASGFVSVVPGADRRSSFLKVASAAGFLAGDYAEIQQTNGSWDTQPVSWADNSIGQILHLTAVSNDTLFFDEELRINYSPSLNPVVRKLAPRKEVGIECLKISRADSVHTGVCLNIYFNFAVNCWVKGVESSKSIGSHIEADASSDITVTGCYIHENFEYDGTSTHGYGITLFNHTGQCRLENNIMRHLRHSFSMQVGANGNVIAYNYSIDPNRSEFPSNYGADISMHGHYSYANLFEGNIVQNIQIDQTWGPSGPFNTFFRNRAELYGILMTSGTVESDSLNFVGNEVTNTGLFMGNYTLAGSNHFEFGNNVRGTITPAGTSSLPDSSYYLDSLPRFWNSSLFPTIGTPNYNTGSNAAKDRYLSGINLATCNEQINTSIADLNANVIDIYPNPASTSITVRFKTEMNHSIPISITDLTGKVLMEETLSTSSQFIEKTIDISVLKAGVYFLRINGSAKIFVLSK